jgi:hypothetical protein
LPRHCDCGQNLNLTLRTVVFAKKVNISGVPVYYCGQCGRNEVFPGIKEDISALIGQLGAQPVSRTIPFDEMHEWAKVLSAALKEAEPLQESVVMRAVEERTNQLLDLLLIASSVGDEEWKSEVKGRLNQLSAQYIS